MPALTYPFNYHEAVRMIEARGVMPNRPPSLEPMKKALTRLRSVLNLKPEKTIVVAGTNGKGSVCASLEALLLSAGCQVGLYTSPHLVETTERIRVNGQDVSQELFCEALEAITAEVNDFQLSHFEILTLMAVWIFFSKKEGALDWAIFEVGLGGTWDATNAIPHQYCVITSLGLDHQNLLGNSLGEIAQNKFGIIHPGATVVHSPLPDEVLPLAKQIKAAIDSRWIESTSFTLEVENTRPAPVFRLNTRWGSTSLALAGERGAQNSATALTLFHELGFNPSQYLSALERVNWPGRMEQIFDPRFPCPIYLSGDHNPQGISSLLNLLKHYSWKHLYLIVGIGKDKNLDGILASLTSIENSSLLLTETPFRGRSLTEYGKWLDAAKGQSPDPRVVLEQARTMAGSEDLILVTGSLYLVGQIKKELQVTPRFCREKSTSQQPL